MDFAKPNRCSCGGGKGCPLGRACPDEWKLVFDSWASSFKKSPWAGCVPNHLWDTVSRATATDLISRSRTLVGVLPLETTDRGGRCVVGYSVSEPERKVLHWLYVKRDYRGFGWGRKILAETCTGEGWVYTHRTRASARFLGPGFTWDPVPSRVKGA